MNVPKEKMAKHYLKGNLYAVNFFYELEVNGSKDFYSKKEIVVAIKKAIEPYDKANCDVS